MVQYMMESSGHSSGLAWNHLLMYLMLIPLENVLKAARMSHRRGNDAPTDMNLIVRIYDLLIGCNDQMTAYDSLSMLIECMLM